MNKYLASSSCNNGEKMDDRQLETWRFILLFKLKEAMTASIKFDVQK